MNVAQIILSKSLTYESKRKYNQLFYFCNYKFIVNWFRLKLGLAILIISEEANMWETSLCLLPFSKCGNIGQHQCVMSLFNKFEVTWYLEVNKRVKYMKNQKESVRSGVRTHAHIRGPEHSIWRFVLPWVWRLRPLGHPDNCYL